MSLSTLNLDVLKCICDAVCDMQKADVGDAAGLLKAFSLTDKRIRRASVPNLYRSVTIQSKTTRECTELMSAIGAAAHLSEHIRSFALDVELSTPALDLFWDTGDQTHIKEMEDTPGFALAFVQILAKMPALRHLALNSHTCLVEPIATDLAPHLSRAVSLPDVKSLSTTLYFCLWKSFPSVTTLSLEVGQMTSDEAQLWGTALRSLKNVTLRCSYGWRVVRPLVSHMQHIVELTLAPRIDLETDLALFSPLRSLVVLNLPGLALLNAGFDPPWCGTEDPNTTPEERERELQMLKQQADSARMEAKRLAQNTFPRLRTLRIGHDGVYDLAA
ncbi:hypothetical protein EXIGLDRAFT_723088 [Exidia glandulosa HHB12029]|uniref:F-box domain-containing protein n=1 Tax=Exidia glandulosa HHB12029 TaxID=1314781 RepID=A0A165EYM0_EXIGL|nr:hypothetical protein EXIGLDRAFT_723088 [Exidia glandulosa HHB12029]